MKRAFVIAAAGLISFGAMAQGTSTGSTSFGTQFDASPAMTNQDVVDMVGMGLDETVIIAKIRSSAVAFDVSAKGLVVLKDQKVPVEVVKVMIERPGGLASIVQRSDTGQFQPPSEQPRAFADVKRILIKAPTEVLRVNAEDILSGKGGPVVNPSSSGYDAVLVVGVDCGKQTRSMWTAANYCTCEGSMTLEIAGIRTWSTTDHERAANEAKAGRKMIDRMADRFVEAWMNVKSK